MDRKEYLIFCQKASVYNEIYVMYDNIKYFPYGYEMKFNNGFPIHTAILKDIKSNSLLYADLERVVKYGT